MSVPRTASLEQAHIASDAVEHRIEGIVPDADVVVHVEPRARSDEDLFETVRAVAQRRGLAVHELSAHQFEGRLFIELHLEVNEGSSLREAHRSATELEEDIRRATDPRARVNIHIEPLGTRIAGAEEMKGLSRSVQDFLNSLQSEYHELLNCHEVHVRSVDHKDLKDGRDIEPAPGATPAPGRELTFLEQVLGNIGRFNKGGGSGSGGGDTGTQEGPKPYDPKK